MTRVWTVLFAVFAAAVFVLVEIWAFREETDTADADTGTSTTTSTTSTTAPSWTSAVPEVVTASGPVDLSPIRIAPDRHGRDYRREAFGPGWAPAGGPGCDVRDVVLARDLVDTTVARGCDVTAGTLYDPYSGQTVTGPTRDLDIDHVIPLALAHRSGAHAWTDAQRDAFANDPDNLRATTAAVNRSKSDHGPERWMPQVDACAYAHDFARVAARYQLTVTEQRAAALQQAEPHWVRWRLGLLDSDPGGVGLLCSVERCFVLRWGGVAAVAV